MYGLRELDSVERTRKANIFEMNNIRTIETVTVKGILHSSVVLNEEKLKER